MAGDWLPMILVAAVFALFALFGGGAGGG